MEHDAGTTPLPPPQPVPGGFPCARCGAKLAFAPGTTTLLCAYCGQANEIPEAATADRAGATEELDFRRQLSALAEATPSVEVRTLHCGSCGADVTKPANVTTMACPFCRTPLGGAEACTKLIRPRALLPFKVAEADARERFRRWLKSLWFAPSALRREGRLDASLRGLYLPYWTYDCQTTTDYAGRRGDHYWDTETYSTTVNGRRTVQTRRVRRTRWRAAAGRVNDRFDDVLVPASTSVPRADLDALEPWDLASLEPLDGAYLAGFVAESYTLDLPGGFVQAQGRMEPVIESSIRRDIGGDEQQIISKRTAYEGVTFKHLLLPVWISAYRYQNTVYRFYVNARTGEVTGQRPWSWAKIAGAVVGALAIVAVVAAIAAALRR